MPILGDPEGARLAQTLARMAQPSGEYARLLQRAGDLDEIASRLLGLAAAAGRQGDMPTWVRELLEQALGHIRMATAEEFEPRRVAQRLQMAHALCQYVIDRLEASSQ